MRVKFKLNAALKGFPVGTILNLIVDKNKKPLDIYWSRRFDDAKLDNCISTVTKQQKEQKKKEEIIE